jgi:hypothetical protein
VEKTDVPVGNTWYSDELHMAQSPMELLGLDTEPSERGIGTFLLRGPAAVLVAAHGLNRDPRGAMMT